MLDIREIAFLKKTFYLIKYVLCSRSILTYFMQILEPKCVCATLFFLSGLRSVKIISTNMNIMDNY